MAAPVPAQTPPPSPFRNWLNAAQPCAVVTVTVCAVGSHGSAPGNLGGARHRDRDRDAELGSGPAGTTACSVCTCTARSWSGAKPRGDHGSHHKSWRCEVAWGPAQHEVFPSTTPTHLEVNRGLRRMPTALHSRPGQGRQLRLRFLF